MVRTSYTNMEFIEPGFYSERPALLAPNEAPNNLEDGTEAWLIFSYKFTIFLHNF